MATYTKQIQVKRIVKENIEVNIFRFSKEGTSRVFYAPEVDGKRITSTLFARLYDAESLATKYINHKSK